MKWENRDTNLIQDGHILLKEDPKKYMNYVAANMKFYTSVKKGLKLKVRKFWGLVPAFLEVTKGKLVGGGLFGPPPS